MTEQTHRNALSPGYKLHWYEIKSVLGQGGFGITYLAQDLNLDRPVAIKEYLPSDFAVREGDKSVHPLSGQTQPQFEWGLERFISEARTLSKFEHPNIVRVFAVFEENNTGYLVMPYEEGTSLQTVLKGKKTLDESTLLKIIEPILDGLELVHQHEFIHRDIKPDNIFIREDGSPVLLDFGSARQSITGQVKTLTTLVSPGYAPFEQYYSKSDEQGPWTDIYGLGATLYRAITGRPPLDAVDRSKSLLDGSQDTFMSATQIGTGHYSESFLKAIDHAISFKPVDRPQTISEWRSEFDFNQENIATEISDRREKATTQPKQRPKRKQRIAPKLVILVLLLIIIIGGGVFYVKKLGEELTTSSQIVNTEINTPEVNVETTTDNETEISETKQAVEEKLLAAQQELEQERLLLEQERKQIEEERLRQEEMARQAEVEKQKQIEEEKRIAEEQRLEQERLAQEEAAKQKEAEAKRIAEEKKREEERLAKEKLELEKQVTELKKQKEEEERRRIEEQKRLEEEKRIAEEQRLEQERLAQEEAAKQAEIELQNKITASQAEFANRYAATKDKLSFVDNVTAQDLKNIESKKITSKVSAITDSWQNSGVTIKRGQTYKIQASGQWSLGPLCETTGATGEGMYTIACWDLGFQTVAKRSHSALIGKIGRDSLAFYIGSDFTFTADKDGTLYMTSNDAPGFFFDNSGELDVQISLIE
jgi:serine/threonine protein kinase